MPSPWLVGGTMAAGGIADFLGGSSAQRKQQRMYDQALQAYMKALDKGKKMYRKKRGALRDAFGIADKEFKRADASIASQGRQYSSDFKRANETNVKDARMALQRSGGSPAMLRHLQRQSAGDLGREGRRAFSGLAGARGSMGVGRAGAMLGIQNALANTYSDQANFNMSGVSSMVGNVQGNAQVGYNPVGQQFGGFAAWLQSLNKGPTSLPYKAGKAIENLPPLNLNLGF